MRKGNHPPPTESGKRDNLTTHDRVRLAARWLLGAFLVAAGLGHLSWARHAFRAQVPDWVPGDVDTIVLLSGVVEIGLGATLIGLRSKWTGWIVGAFFVAVFPGNISQYANHRDAFGLDTDTRRAVRLLLQPILVAWAIWSTSNIEPRTRPVESAPDA